MQCNNMLSLFSNIVRQYKIRFVRLFKCHVQHMFVSVKVTEYKWQLMYYNLLRHSASIKNIMHLEQSAYYALLCSLFLSIIVHVHVLVCVKALLDEFTISLLSGH